MAFMSIEAYSCFTPAATLTLDIGIKAVFVSGVDEVLQFLPYPSCGWLALMSDLQITFLRHREWLFPLLCRNSENNISAA
jgi:hypothetical protein